MAKAPLMCHVSQKYPHHTQDDCSQQVVLRKLAFVTFLALGEQKELY